MTSHIPTKLLRQKFQEIKGFTVSNKILATSLTQIFFLIFFAAVAPRFPSLRKRLRGMAADNVWLFLTKPFHPPVAFSYGAPQNCIGLVRKVWVF